MKKADVTNAMLAGAFLIVAEYRSGAAEVINWRDKDTGRALSATVLRHVIEVGQHSVTVNERVPEGAKVEDIKFPAKKGDKVLLHLSSMETTKGMISVRGRIEPIEA